MNKKRLTILTAILMLTMALLTACSSPGGADSAEAPAATVAPAEESPAADAEEGSDADADAESPADADSAESESEEEADDAETASSGERTFVVVPGESTASYIVNEEFLADALSKLGIDAGEKVVTGSTGDVEGSLTIDPENRTLSDGVITVNMTTLVTGEDRRDNWLQSKGPQFGNFPTAEFVATGIEGAPDSFTEGEEVSFQLMGDLTVRDATLPVTFDVTATVSGDTLTGVAETNMNISDFGITPPDFARTLKVADPFVIRIELTATAE